LILILFAYTEVRTIHMEEAWPQGVWSRHSQSLLLAIGNDRQWKNFCDSAGLEVDSRW